MAATLPYLFEPTRVDEIHHAEKLLGNAKLAFGRHRRGARVRGRLLAAPKGHDGRFGLLETVQNVTHIAFK